ncbi:MAG TPA: response regulator [Nitrospinaceae bacterium]|nr:response regulator [Nitrospinaceae bacterium]
MLSNRILLVEDEPHIAEALTHALNEESLDTTRVGTISDAREAYKNNTFDLIILDVGLPDGNGFDFCKEIRGNGDNIPIIFLTARSDEVDEVRGLSIGADDYVKKPFSAIALSIKIKKILVKKEEKNSTPSLSPLQLHLDEAKKRITFKGENLNLSSIELSILSLLLKRPGQVYSPDQIIAQCWVKGGENVINEAVAFHIKNIRKKFEDIDPKIDAKKDILVNHVGLGYSVKD